MIIKPDATHAIFLVPDKTGENYSETAVPLDDVPTFNRTTSGRARLFFVLRGNGEKWPARVNREVPAMGQIEPFNGDDGDRFLHPWREIREIWTGDNPAELVWTANGPGPDGRVATNPADDDPTPWL